jgi:tol-pal system protein YbgF
MEALAMRLTGIRFACALAGFCASIVGAPAAARAADKGLIELQRQVANLSDRFNTLQAAFNTTQSNTSEKLGAEAALLQQTLDGVNQIRAANAVAAKTLADSLNQQEQKVAMPVAALNARIDQLIQTVSTTQENMADLSSRMGKMEQRLADIENLVKVLQVQPAQTPGGPPPGVTAQGLSQDAARDQLSGKYDLALQEYTDYLKYFGDTEAAASAQFHIGEILALQGKTDQAIQAFDLAAGQYPMSGKAPEALYAKAQALKKAGKKVEATKVLNQLVRQYPDSDAAANAKADLASTTRK